VREDVGLGVEHAEEIGVALADRQHLDGDLRRGMSCW
jgi:hypothetical protein